MTILVAISLLLLVRVKAHRRASSRRREGTAAKGEHKRRHYERCLAAIISKATIAEVAADAGVSQRTLQRYLVDPEFKEHLNFAKSRLLDGAVDKLRTAAVGAVGTLITVSDDPTELGSSRVSAAKAIIELALRAGTRGPLLRQ